MSRSFATFVLGIFALTAAPLGAPPVWALEPAGDKAAKKKSRGKKDRRPFVPWEELEKVPNASEWFEVYRVRPGVMAIYEPRHPQRTISYLILGEEKALLFDTGLGIGDLAALTSELTDLEVAVLNSHTHGDHIGSNHQFAKIYGTDTEFTRNNARGEAADGAAADGSEEVRFSIQPFEIDETVRDGQTIDLGGRRLEVLLTPGHAPDALCLLDRENRLLWTGDTFYLGQLYAHLEHSDLDLYRKTTSRLASLTKKVDTVLPAHLVTAVRGDFLRRLHLGFRSIFAASVPHFLSGQEGVVLYRFEGFSVLVRERDARRFVPDDAGTDIFDR